MRRWLCLGVLAFAQLASAEPLVWLSKPDGCRQCEPCRAPEERQE